MIYAIQNLDATATSRAPYHILKGFAANGWSTEVVTLSSPANAGMDALWEGVPVRRIDGRNRRQQLLRIGQYLFARPADSFVISWVWDWHCIFLALAMVAMRKPYGIVLDTLTFRNPIGWRETVWQEFRYGFALRNANLILAETERCREEACRYLRRPTVALVPPGFWERDLRAVEERWARENATPERRPVILYPGRIVPRKNIHDLIDAFGAVAAKFPEWTLDLRGPQPNPAYAASLRAQVARLGLTDRILFQPAVSGDTLCRAYRSSSIFALPSEGEGFPAAVLEAMYFGGAIVAAPSGYVADQLGNDGCALYHDVHDVEGLAAQLERLMGSVSLRDQLMSAARRRMIELFTWERHFPQVEETIHDIVEQSVEAHATMAPEP